MADVFTPEKRSQVMSRIRSKGNRATELALSKLLRSHRIRGWRRHLPLPGTPDFAFRSHKIAIFVDGCFWHSCPKCSNRPVSNADFWAKKLSANVVRDQRVNAALVQKGWRVVRIWQHELRNPNRVIAKISRAMLIRDLP